MAQTLYPYTKEAPLDVASLKLEVDNDATVTVDVDYVEFIEPDNLTVAMADALTGPQETALTAVITAHAGTSLSTYWVWCNTESLWFQMEATSQPTECPNGHGDIAFPNTFGDPEIFGSAYQLAANDAESSVTGDTNYHEKLKLTTPVLPAGDYFVTWFYEWSSDNNIANRFKGRLQIDDTVTPHEICIRPGMKYSDGEWEAQGGFVAVTLTNASHTIDIDFATDDAGKISYIRRVRIVIWRIN